MPLIANILPGTKALQSVIIGLAVIAVAIADVCLKKASLQQDLNVAARSPWLWSAVALYLLQIGLFTYAFASGWKLSALGALQTALYGVIVLVAGVVFYHETLTPAQTLGIVLALGGVVLINWR